MWQPIETAPKDQFLLLCGLSGYTTTPMVVTTGRMCSDYHTGRWIDHANDDLTDWGFKPTHWAPLILPGAKSAPSEKDEPIRKAWARFSNALHRSPDAPYPGMSEAFEKHFSQSFTDREWRAESGVWAAAWKAAKNHGAPPTLRVPPDAIDAINRARETAMKHTLAARIPECGVFAEIAQDLDYAQSKLVPEAKP